jgi:mannose-1-phosphate guanylyltransferase
MRLKMRKDSLTKHLYALVICGGGGTRLWPRSRNKTPKQFSRLFGKETLYQKTVKRLRGLVPSDKIYVVTTSKQYASEIKKETPNIPSKNIFWEPTRRNTAIACGLGTLIIYKRDPQAVIMNFWADHLVEKEDVFRKVEKIAAAIAFEKRTLVAIGIKPKWAHTGLGYIKAGDVFKKINGVSVCKLEKFIEKPDQKTAEKFLESGDYYWNSGMYVWQAEFFLGSLEQYAPETFVALEKIRNAIGKKEFLKAMKIAYEGAPDISVDVAVSEKIKNAFVIPADFGWNDVGDWSIIYELASKDRDGNAIIKFGQKGEFIGLEARNNLIQFDDQLIAAIGVEDLIIVDTTDVILICRKKDAQKVKELVNLLKEKNKNKYL